MRALSRFLRHAPPLDMDDGGWVPVTTLAALLRVDPQDILNAVDMDGKARMEYDRTHTLVRARYGHSIPLPRVAWMDHPMKLPPEGAKVMHATTHANWEKIQKDGYLRPMNRQAVHFSIDKKLLRNRPVVLLLDVNAATKDGISLYWATDKIVVSPHNIPTKYLHVHKCL